MVDKRLRENERDAAGGNDPMALERLERNRCRAGQHCACLKYLLTGEERNNLRKIIAALQNPQPLPDRPSIYVFFNSGSTTDLAERLSELLPREPFKDTPEFIPFAERPDF